MKTEMSALLIKKKIMPIQSIIFLKTRLPGFEDTVNAAFKVNL